MKRQVYLLFILLAAVSISTACGGGARRKAADTETNTEETSKSGSNGILPYTAPAIGKIDTVAKVRDFRGVEPMMRGNAKRLVLPDFFTDYQFHDGMLAIRNRTTNKWGFVDTLGNMAIDFVWLAGDSFPYFNHGVTVVKRNEGIDTGSAAGSKEADFWYIIDKRGEVVKKFPKETKKVSQFVDGYAWAVIGNRFQYINTRGEEIFKSYGCLWNNSMSTRPLREFSEGLLALFDPALGMWGFVDKDGNDVVPSGFLDVSDYGGGLIPVLFPATETMPRKWGAMDTNENVVIPAMFTNPISKFSEGYAVVTLTNDNQAYIDITGAVISPEFLRATPFINGRAVVQRLGYHVDDDMEIVDKNFNTLKDNLPSDDVYPHLIRYYQDGEYFTMHNLHSNDLASPYLYQANGEQHTILNGWKGSIKYDIWNFYGNLAHLEVEINDGFIDGFIDFNKGLEYVFLLEKSNL